jgi:hypothetical protein
MFSLRLIQEEITLERKALEAMLGKSRFLSAAKSGTRTFVIGALAGLAASPLEYPEVPVATAAATEELGLIWSYLSGSCQEHIGIGFAALQPLLRLTAFRRFQCSTIYNIH